MLLTTSDRDFRRLMVMTEAIVKELGILLPLERQTLNLENYQMAAIDDLNAAVAKIAASVQTAVTELNTAHQNDDDAGVEAAAQKLSDLADALAAAPAQAVAANPAPANPPPANPAPTGAVPVIASLTPAVGSINGGDSISINGTNLGGLTGVTFDGVASPSLTADADTVCTVITPPHDAGTVDVVVTTAGGVSAAAQFTYA